MGFFLFLEVVMWTGDPEQCIMREGLLEVVAGVLDDQIVLEWGIPCNRAMRHLFPSLTIKRRGKYKTYPFVLTMIDYDTHTTYYVIVEESNHHYLKC